MEIGNRIKEVRMQKGLTQEELADRAELTKGFISQVERDLTSPSIATLGDILQCLGVTPAEFFTEEKDEQIVFKADDYFEKVDPKQGNTVRWIVPNAQKNVMEPILLTLDEDGSTYPDNPHEGDEFGYVLSGRIALCIGDKVHRVKKGETFYFSATKVHYIKALSKGGAQVLWVSSPPSF